MGKANTEKRPISFWGIGPIFVILSLLVSGMTLFFTFRNPEYFRFKCCSGLFYIVGFIVTIFGFSLGVGGGVKIRKYFINNILATKGEYGIVRNPVYSGILFVMTGIFLCLQSWLILVTIPFTYFILKLLLTREDKALTEAFGEEYIQYKKEVNAIIPKVASFYPAFFYPEETRKITENLSVIKSHDGNIYIYKTENQCLCFDTGYGNKELVDGLKKIKINPDDVSKVFLTHTDHDHTKGIHLFKNAEIYFGKNEEPLINGTKHRFSILYSNPKITRKYTLLANHQVITIDNTEIKIVFMPGHTIGQVTYLINNSIAITGDAIIWQNGFIKPFYRLLNMKHRQAKKSAKELTKYQGKYIICTAHTGVINANFNDISYR